MKDLNAPKRLDRPGDTVRGLVGARPTPGFSGHDRFRRDLGLARREAPSWDAAALSYTDEEAPSADLLPPWDVPSNDSRDDSSDHPSGDSPAEPLAREAGPHDAEPKPAFQLAAPSHDTGAHRDEHTPATRNAGAVAVAKPADGPPAWLLETAQQVEWLCARADPAFQTWAVTVPMDPAVLPDTELALSLSPFAMTLRFRTRSEQSVNLISLHRGQLQALLEKLPSPPQSIDIDLE